MKSDTQPTDASLSYAEAYATHYSDRNLLLALQQYRQVVQSHPETAEAGYSISQIRSIVNAVVPSHDLVDAQVAMAIAQFDKRDRPGGCHAGAVTDTGSEKGA